MKPEDTAECLSFGDVCRYKERYASAARFYADAVAASPRPADGLPRSHRYHAACVAVRAAAGEGLDADKLDAQQRARLRQQALDWLRSELKALEQSLEKNEKQFRPAPQRTLPQWQGNPDLASVRDEPALAKLSESERQVWRQFWKDVEALLHR